jgi:hypothetical protein
MAIFQMCLIGVLQTKILLVLYKRRKTGKHIQQHSETKEQNTLHLMKETSAVVEVKMALSTFLLFIAMLFKVIFFIMYIAKLTDFAFSIFMYATDTFSLINSILLFVTSQCVRQMIYNFVIRRKKYTFV